MATYPIVPLKAGPVIKNLLKPRVPAGGFGLALKNASPTIMVVGGCIGVGVGVVLACKATLKADQILDEIEEEVNKVNHVRDITDEETYSEKDFQKDMTIVYAKGGARLVKLYLPAIIAIIGSLALILGGHRILLHRQLALAAAYEAVSKGYDAYRGRVIEDLGEDADRKYAYGIKEEVVGEESFVDDDGKKHKKKIKAQIPSTLASPYAFYWDDTCNGWEPNPYYNETFLIGKQREWNRKLAQRWQLNGFVTLAEIKCDLGVLVRPEDISVGWIYDPSGGTEQIDFGIFSPKNSDAINGSEPVYILEPNVQGQLVDILPSRFSA
jgi:hypothetical protein